jgi:hypothetical protein
MLTNWGDLLTNVPASGTSIAPADYANTLTVADSTARLALVYGTGTGQVQELDQVLQTSDSTLWVLLASDPSVSGNWSRLPGNDASALTTGTLPAARYTSSPTTNNLLKYNGTLLVDSALSDNGTRMEVSRPLSLTTVENTTAVNVGISMPATGYLRLHASDSHQFMRSTTPLGLWGSTGLCVGDNAASAKKLEVVDSAAAQLRLTHTAGTHYSDHTVDGSGNYSLNPSGGKLALGKNAAAAGSTATSLGQGASASGDQSLAASINASAAGYGATALGAISSASANYTVALGWGATAATANTMVCGSDGAPINTIWAGKGAPHATPTAWGIQGTSGLGTDIAGGACHLRGGQPTGSGLGGSAILQTAAPGATGTALRSLVDRLEADAHGVIWIHPVTTAPTVGRTDMIGLFSDAGVLKFIKEDNSVVTVTAS